MKHPLLEVENLSVSYQMENKRVQVVRDLSFSIDRGETLAIVGESGSGKTATALSIIGLLPDNGKIDKGKIYFDGKQLAGQTEKEWVEIRGKKIAMIMQDPMSALNPVLTIGRQMEEVFLLRRKEKVNKKRIRQECLSLLGLVGVTEPELRLNQYPHELSGGILQRITIAIALAGKPDLLIADEPTTALDGIIKKQILSLLADLQKQLNLSILLITHDLAETATLADKVLVLYAGKAVEYGKADLVLKEPQHPYTKSLLKAVPTMDLDKNIPLFALKGQPPKPGHLPPGCAFHPRCPIAEEKCKKDDALNGLKEPGPYGRYVSCIRPKEERKKLLSAIKLKPERSSKITNIFSGENGAPILEIHDLKKHFKAGNFLSRKVIKAVDGISFTVNSGQITAIVGESGSGKSTLWKTIVGLHQATGGEVYYLGKKLKTMKDKRAFYQQVGFVFQNASASFNPRMTVGESILEPLRAAKWNPKERNGRLERLFELVGLPMEKRNAYPNELSGGQQQRAAIARALSVNPKIMILDEPVSSLDVSIQAQIINLLKELQEKLQISMLFISHDLPLVRYFADQVLVMHHGKLVERAKCEELFAHPTHPYSEKLIRAFLPSEEKNKTVHLLCHSSHSEMSGKSLQNRERTLPSKV
ncbi:dipeptide ABC transporter ATP-binding protein [Ureibacillus terrenus]|uniref:Dipeptide ABC transporter ATP-binding protein n=1 Tax=Ureibacillus terrenus TaxID=118246 RepID=A0A540V6T5_9BACL|nr:ABC transporter ATP-binding protein [Ureibacillus terrenus]MED3762637.1 ABC transporter ATP-binding protein [Ureibacillus terrenus]TQE92484.1 dipeptide ABC transporter ATP-binding protein [Ureibacillus terrenus]